MKLRNKKTGEIRELPDGFFCGDNLKKICEEWEDYDEPKEYWYVDTTEGSIVELTHEQFELTDKERKEIGNYFDTREEAEKAVERLRAWKRLKDKGVEFYGWRRNQTGTYDLLIRWKDRVPRSYEVKNDLDLLFSRGKE